MSLFQETSPCKPGRPPSVSPAGGHAGPTARAASPARCGCPAGVPRRQAERGAARAGQAAQDGRGEGHQGCPGTKAGKGGTPAAGGQTARASHLRIMQSLLLTFCEVWPRTGARVGLSSALYL